MAIQLKSVLPVSGARAPTPADVLATRRADGDGAPSNVTELARAQRPGQAATARGNPAVAPGQDVPPDPVDLTRAVEDANALAESVLRAANRSVQFGKHEASGRVVITIREEQGGEVVQRQIPPPEFLRLVERLREAARGGKSSGAFIDLET